MNNKKHQIKIDGVTYTEAVLCFVIDTTNNLLLLKRKDNKKWEVVKGSIEVVENKPETPEDATRRELEEETGMTNFKNLHKLDEIKDSITNSRGIQRNIYAHIFKLVLNEEKPEIIIEKDGDHSDHKWVNIDLIDEEELYPVITFQLINRHLRAKYS